MKFLRKNEEKSLSTSGVTFFPRQTDKSAFPEPVIVEIEIAYLGEGGKKTPYIVVGNFFFFFFLFMKFFFFNFQFE